MGELVVFSGGAHPVLTQEICNYLKIPVGQSETFKFKNDNSFVRLRENVRSRDVFIVQPTAAPVNDNVMETLIMIDAAKRASAGRITAVIPYFSYGRTDKKDQPRVPITARLVADLITVAGADRVVTVDL
ncbi:MAG: ribose-phosphate pyrophosphokinase-like domain-containing protein, partial [Dehalococcoidia bacterium]